MAAPLLFYLPAPIGWVALSPSELREAQERAIEVLGVPNTSDEAPRQAEARDCVSAQEAARALGVEASWLLRRARMRRIPFLRAGKYVRFDVDALRAHLAKIPK